MLRSHVSLLDSFLAKLRFAGSPEPCLQPLLDVRARSSVRGREFFNEPSLFLEATKEALLANDACVDKLGDLASWDAALSAADPPPSEVLAARLRAAAELLATEEKNERASALLMRAVEVAPSPPSAVLAVDTLCKEKLYVPSSTQRSALLALDYFLRFSGDDPLSFPWPAVIRWLTLRTGDESGTDMAYAVAREARHPSPAALVKPQPFAGDATAKARKGSALLYAASVGDTAAVEAALRLVGTGAVDNSMDHGVTPLMLACRVGAVGAVRVLLDAAANPNLQSTARCNALAIAAMQKHSDGSSQPATALVDALLASKADVNIGHPARDTEPDGAEAKRDVKSMPRKNIGLNFPLLAAVTRGSNVARNVLVLLRAGADANARDGFNMTALHHAVRADNGYTVMALLADESLQIYGKRNPFDEMGGPAWPGRTSLEVNVADHNGGESLHAIRLAPHALWVRALGKGF